MSLSPIRGFASNGLNPFIYEFIMFYLYVLLSDVDRQFYTGATSDLKSRLKQDNEGKVQSTKNRRPLQLLYSCSIMKPA